MNSVDPRRPDRVVRYKPPLNNGQEDLMPDYMNILGEFSVNLCDLLYFGIFRNDFLNVWPDDEAQMGSLVGAVCFLYQFRQFQGQ